MTTTQITQYLDRIQAEERSAPDLDYLTHLQHRHLLSIPFENLDIHWKRPIVLAKEPVFQKLILQKRGGYCYELNGLFCCLLTSLGFKSYLVSARVYQNLKGYSPLHDHASIVVQLAERNYLVDVGFGGFCREPILLMEEEIIPSFPLDYRVDRYYTYWRINAGKGKAWLPEFIFKQRPYSWSDFEQRSHFHQTDPTSHFAAGPLISILTEQGRITLTNKKWKVAGQEEILIQDGEEFAAYLQQYFGIWR